LLFRNMTVDDIPAGLRLCRASGWNQLESDWRVFLDWNPPACRVVERDGNIIGTIAALRYRDCFSWLSMVLVEPAERGAGIGVQLLQEGLAMLQGDCVRLDATPLGRPIYARNGFVDQYPLSRMIVTVNAQNFVPSPCIRPMLEEDLARVFLYDREVFGADRSRLLRALFLLAPHHAWVAGRAGSMEGYSFGRPGFLYEQIGPVIAQRSETAQNLVSACVSSQNGTKIAIDVPASDPTWLTWLEGHGFAKTRTFVRMCRGDNNHPGSPPEIFAIAGPEFG
jgi:GNAT superfamily N-acetyltransferase